MESLQYYDTIKIFYFEKQPSVKKSPEEKQKPIT